MDLVNIRSIANPGVSPDTGRNFGSGCAREDISYQWWPRRCRKCFYRVTCKEGTKLLKRVSRMKLGELPEYLTHEHVKIRTVAKKRLEELLS